MAYKVFTNGSPLPASDLQTFLMNQSVMTFANSTARTAALPTPTEGMVTWLDDTNRLDVWNGSSWVLVNDNAASVPLSTVTATGDLIVGNGNASVTRLGIGTNGQILQSNGTTATWVTPAAAGGASVVWSLLGTVNLASTPTSTITFSGISNRKKLFVEVNNLAWSAGSAGQWWFLQINGSSSTANAPVGLEGLGASPWLRPSDFSTGLILSTLHNSSVNGFATAVIHDAELSTNSQVDIIAGVQGGGTPPNSWHKNFSTIATKSAPVTSVSIGNSWGSTFTSGTVRLWGGV